MSSDDVLQQLRILEASEAVKVIGSWLGEHSLHAVLDSFQEAVLNDPALNTHQGGMTGGAPQLKPQSSMPFVKPPNAAPLTAPTNAQSLPSSNPARMGKLYDAEPVSSSRVPGELLMKPEPVFHGERDNQQREMAPVYEFPMHVRLLTQTHAQPRSSPVLTVLGATRAGDLRPPHVGPRVR
jgi:hypothetical protein